MDATARILSGLSSRTERERALRWLARLAEVDRIRIVHAAATLPLLPLPLGMPEPAPEVRSYCALLLAVRQGGYDTIRRRGYRVAGPEQLEEFTAVRLSRAKNLKPERQAPLRAAIEKLWAEVVELKAEGLGFRIIARYLHEQRRLPQVSEAYLRKLWAEHGGNSQLVQTNNSPEGLSA